jgi:hypothetical protein
MSVPSSYKKTGGLAYAIFKRIYYTYGDPKLEPFLIYKKQWQSPVPNIHTSFPSTK